MNPITLDNLLLEDGVKIVPNGLSVHIQPSWIVKGEDRLSYTTIVQLVECCRELHWLQDIKPKLSGEKLDSICKSFSAKFLKPIIVGAEITISYKIAEVRKKGYSSLFLINNKEHNILYAELELVSVFYDPRTRQSVTPPLSVFKYLSNSFEVY